VSEQERERSTWSCDNCGRMNARRRRRCGDCRTSRFQGNLGEPSKVADPTLGWITAWGADAAVVFRTPGTAGERGSITANGITIPDF
jgi:hypothetical protein